jgi:hypothetical protein
LQDFHYLIPLKFNPLLNSNVCYAEKVTKHSSNTYTTALGNLFCETDVMYIVHVKKSPKFSMNLFNIIQVWFALFRKLGVIPYKFRNIQIFFILFIIVRFILYHFSFLPENDSWFFSFLPFGQFDQKTEKWKMNPTNVAFPG